MPNPFGVKTIANDGVEYSSKFEAEFVNRMLLPNNIKYEPQKRYSENSLHRCDFYLPDYDIFVECVYHPDIATKKYMLGSNDIAISIPKGHEVAIARVKNLGAKWVGGQTKKWIIPRSSIKSPLGEIIERYLPSDMIELAYDLKTRQMTEDYVLRLREKLYKFQETHNILQVNKIDLEKNGIKNFADLLRVKNNELYKKIILSKPDLMPAPGIVLPKPEAEYERKIRIRSANHCLDQLEKRKKRLIDLLRHSTVSELQDWMEILYKTYSEKLDEENRKTNKRDRLWG
jgi:hypothetical protein